MGGALGKLGIPSTPLPPDYGSSSSSKRRPSCSPTEEPWNKKQKTPQADNIWRENFAGDPPHPGSYAGELAQILDPREQSRLRKYLSSAREGHDARQELKKKKRKVAIVLAYKGTAYSGLQLNAGVRTIEAEVEKALFFSGAILPSNFGYLGKIGWSRAARTDKGVHAAGQVLVAKALVADCESGANILREELNRQLPVDIRVLDVLRVQGCFHAKQSCQGRTYRYFIPTFCFCPLVELQRIFERARSSSQQVNKPGKGAGAEIAQLASAELSDWRMSEDVLDFLRILLHKYEGTRKYHNYTRSKSPDDASALRFMTRVTAGQPREINGKEWVCLSFEGQSFLLNQIRIMVAQSVQVVCGVVSVEEFEASFGPELNPLPIAPAEGLYLDELHYDGYNRKVKSTTSGNNQLWWPMDSRVQHEKQDFIDNVICHQIFTVEPEEHHFLTWMEGLEYGWSHRTKLQQKVPA